MTDWQPMETAPRDGTRILVFTPGEKEWDGVMTAKWCKTYNCWWGDPNEASEYDPDSLEPTLWMPTPALPARDDA